MTDKREELMSHIWSKEEVRSFKLLLRRITEKYESEEDVKEARAVAKLLIEINADDAEAWYFLGGLNIILGELDEAQKNLFRSLELGGEKLPNYILLANVYANQGKFKEALIWSYKARKCDPKNVFVYRRIADLHVQDGDTVKAIKVLQQLLKIPSIKDNDLYSALVEIGNLCMQTQRMNKALEYFKAAQKINSSDADLLTKIGHCLSRSGDLDGALNTFKMAANLDPNSLNLYNLGDAYLSVNDPEKSIAPLIEATRKDPTYSMAHYDLSLAFIMMNKYNEGATAAIAALRPDPEMNLQRTNPGLGAMGNLGLCLMNLGRHDEALECFRRNIKLLSSTYFNMGLTLFRMKLFKEALKYFLHALEMKPDDPEYINLVGQTYDNLGKNKVAEHYLRESIKKDSKYALGYYDLGVILAKFKTRRKEAFQCFMRAIKLNPHLAWAYYSVACLHALSGNKEKALDYLEQSLEKGLSNKKHIDTDKDMDSLRKDKEFKKMMIKYFSHPKK